MRSMVEGSPMPVQAPSTTAFGGGPPPRSGEEVQPSAASAYGSLSPIPIDARACSASELVTG